MQLNLSRRAFADKCGFSAATLQAWEEGRYLIPTNSLIQYIQALSESGLVTTKSWFLQGLGQPPKPINAWETIVSPEKDTIQKEIKFFETVHTNPIILQIKDDSMLPFFDFTDFVGGILDVGTNASNYIGDICIIILISGEILVRKVRPGTIDGYYNLVSTNIDTDVPNAFISNCQIQELAKVIWHRKSLITEGQREL